MEAMTNPNGDAESETVEVTDRALLLVINDKLDDLLRWKEDLDNEIKPMLESLASGGPMAILSNMFKRG